MNRKPRALLIVTSVAIIVAAILSILIRIGIAESEGLRAAKADFEELSIGFDGVRNSRDLADAGLRLKLARHYASSPSLLLALVMERGRGLAWRIPDRSPYLPASENLVLDPRFRHPDRSSILLEAPLRGDSSGRLVLEALYVAIPQSSVFLAFRDAALGLGIWLVALLVVLLAFGGGREADATWRVGGSAVKLRGLGAQNPGKPDDPYAEGPEISDSLADADFEAEVAAEADQLDPTFSYEGQDESMLEAEKEDSTDPLATLGGAAPQGLFSPLSGLGWESYLPDRLEAELSRAASFEQDLSLLLVSFEGLGPGDSTYALISSTIADFFSFKDLAFERGPDGFAVLLPNLDADHGLRMAEEFHKKVTFLIREQGYSEPLDSLPLYIGLSSRAGRLVEATRLLGEAEVALVRAREEDTKILAFKPDPDKYRLFLASKGI